MAWPETPQEIARVLRYAEKHNVPVVPYGAGSGVAGGARPSPRAIALDLKRMRHLRRLDPDNLSAEVECGIIGERLERNLQARGYTLGHFPSSIGCSTLGGWLAARSAGQMSTAYGKIEDMCLGLEVVSPGCIRRLETGPRPLGGIDYNALLIGSEGTMGVISSALLRIHPLPAARRFRGFKFPSVEAGVEAIQSILHANIRPAVVRLYDGLDTWIARTHTSKKAGPSTRFRVPFIEAQWSELQKHPKVVEWAHRMSEGLRQKTIDAVLGAKPDWLNRAAEFLPGECLLVLGFEGQPARVIAQAKAAEAFCLKTAKDLGPEPGEHWYATRYNVSFKQSKMYASGVFVDTMEVAATWERLMPLYFRVRAAIQKHALVMAHFSHAYPEGCSIYFTFAGAATNKEDPQAAIARYDALWRDALVAVHEAGGTISHHHGVGQLKAHAMAQEHGSGGIAILNALKGALDPKGILNPNKLGLGPVSLAPDTKKQRVKTTSPVEALIRDLNPQAVQVFGRRVSICPRDERTVMTVLRLATRLGVPLTSDQSEGRAPRGAVRVHLDHLEGITKLSEKSLIAEVEAGVPVERLERLLNGHDLTLGDVDPRARRRSIGAAAARNLLIRRSVAYGALGNICLAVRGVLANGTLIETRPTPRSATGPELDRVLVGAGGKLGLMTRLTLRLAALPAYHEPRTYVFGTLAQALHCAKEALRHGLHISSARVTQGSSNAYFAANLVASTAELLRAERTVLAATATHHGGKVEQPGVASDGGHFDAVVEFTCGWGQAESLLCALQKATQTETWADFLTPQGVTIVTRVVDGPSRRKALLAGPTQGGCLLDRQAQRFGHPHFNVQTVVDGDNPEAVAGSTGADIRSAYGDLGAALARRLDPSAVLQSRAASHVFAERPQKE